MKPKLSIQENRDQLREQTQIWMDNYNNHRSLDSLGKIPPMEYARRQQSVAPLDSF